MNRFGGRPAAYTRVGQALACAAILLVGITCSDGGPTGPRAPNGLLARLGFAPSFSRAAAEIFKNLEAFSFEVNNVRLHLKHANGSTAKDTTIAVAAGQDSVVIQIGLAVAGSQEALEANIELRDDDVVLFSGKQIVIATVGGRRAPPSIPVDYTGPGAGATSLRLTPTDTVVLAGQSMTLRPTAKDANGQAVTNLALAWSVKDGSRGTIDGHGMFTALSGAGRGDTYVFARLLTGPKDSAHIVVSLPAAQVVLISGSTSGTVGEAIAQNIVVESRASDNLAAPFTPLTFAVASGGGSVSSAAAVTDANGRASTSLTLGTVAGPNVVQVSGSGITPLSITVAAQPGAATRLAVLQQPAVSVVSGATLAVQPSVRLQDKFGNNAAVANIPITATLTAPSQHTLSGTLTVNTDASGIARFTDLQVSGPTGAASLTFVQGTLTSAVSSAIVVQTGAATTIALEGPTSVSLVAGTTFSNAPALVMTDASGNGVANLDVHLEVSTGQTAIASKDVKTDAQGRASFSVLSIPTTVGSYVMTASSPSFPGVSRSVPLTVTHAAAHHLRFVQQPRDGTGAAADVPVSVEVLDQFGNRVTTGTAATGPVQLQLGGGTTGAILGPTTAALTQAAVAGLATLTVTIDRAGTGFVLTASADASIANASSNAFSIVGASAGISALAGNGVGLLKGEGTALRALVSDAGGNPISGSSVTFSIVSGGGLLAGGTAPVSTTTGTNGQASVSWNVGSAGAQIVRARTATDSLDFRAFIAETLKVIQEPTPSPQSGVRIPQQPRVQLQDMQGNQVKRAGISVLAGAQLDPVSQTLVTQLSGSVAATTDANGEAMWTDLTVSGQTPAGSPQTVKFVFSNGGAAIQPTYSTIMTLGVGPASEFVPENSGDPYYVFDGTSQGSVGVHVTDGFNDIPNSAVRFSVLRGSCVLDKQSVTTDAFGVARVGLSVPSAMTSCAIQAQPDVTQPPPDRLVFLRVYNAPTGMPVWLGKSDKSWDNKSNWYRDLNAGPGSSAFIPAGLLGLDNFPSLSEDTPLKSLYIEAGALLETNGKAITVSEDLAVDGTIAGNGTVVVEGRTGQLRAGYIEGLLQVGTSADRSVTGNVVVDSLEINNILRLDENFVVATNGALRTQGNGQLIQNKGAILVQTDATFDGALANLLGGSLQVMGNFTHNGSCENRQFIARDPHVTYLTGDAEKDALRLTWNTLCPGSRFGTLAIQTKGANGVVLATKQGSPQSIQMFQLYVGSGASLTVPTLFTIGLDLTPKPGSLTLADDSSLLSLENRTAMPLNLECTKPLAPGPNRGPLTCTMK